MSAFGMRIEGRLLYSIVMNTCVALHCIALLCSTVQYNTFAFACLHSKNVELYISVYSNAMMILLKSTRYIHIYIYGEHSIPLSISLYTCPPGMVWYGI